jgi:hypothetical protein
MMDSAELGHHCLEAAIDHPGAGLGAHRGDVRLDAEPAAETGDVALKNELFEAVLRHFAG